MRTRILAAITCCVVAPLAGCSPAAPTADTGQPLNVTYQTFPIWSQMMVGYSQQGRTVIGCVRAPGSGQQMYWTACDQTDPHQFFQWESNEPSPIKTWDGQCVDDYDFELSGAVVQEYPCNGGTNQNWYRNTPAGQAGPWIGQHSGECIQADVGGSASYNLYQEPCDSTWPTQQYAWPVAVGKTNPYTPSTIQAYAPATPNLVLGVPAGQNNTNGAPVQIQNGGSAITQSWYYDSNTREIHLTDSADFGGMCLDVAGGNSQDGNSWVIIWPCYGGPSQQWVQAGSQWVNVNSGKCLDVPGWSVNPGQQVWTWTCWGGLNQQWNGPHN